MLTTMGLNMGNMGKNPKYAYRNHTVPAPMCLVLKPPVVVSTFICNGLK